LGYGGTAGEMARLINDSGVLGKSIKVTNKTVADVPFDKVIEAINVIQTRMGITGTTALEAGRTIAGSVGAMKSAWTNLVTGLADGNTDIGKLVDNLVTTIVGDGTEANLGVLGNVMPAVKTALSGASKLVGELLPKIVQEIPSIINDNLPVLAEAAISIIQSLVDGISQNKEMLMTTAMETITFLATSLISMLPQIVQLGLDLIVSLANGIAESLPELIPTIIDVVLKIVETLTNQETLTQLLGAAFTIITELAWGLIDNIDKLLDAVFLLIDGMIDFLLRPANLAMLIETAIELVLAIGTGIIKAIPQLLVSVGSLIASIFANFFTADWKSIGTNLVDGLKKGISNAWTNLKKWFKNLFGDLIGIAKRILGIASPSKVFKKIGGFTAEGFGAGFEDEFAHVKDDMEDALNFEDASVGINASIRKVCAGAAGGALGGTSIGNININIDGAKYSDEQSLASAIALEIQNMTDRRAAVYA
jgi:phage-related protein